MNKEIDCHNFLLGPTDTDSVSICYPDYRDITKQEQQNLIDEINSLMPELIKFEHDGYYRCIIALKAKNYVLQGYDGKIKIKGSALKTPNKEPALKEFTTKLINSILEDKNNYTDIYNEYVKEILAIKDINRWATKKTVSDKTLESERSNESRIRDAFAGEEVSEGDRLYMFFREEKVLSLVKNFDGVYCREKLLKKLFQTAQIFDTILNTDELFINYSLKRNKKALDEIWCKL